MALGPTGTCHGSEPWSKAAALHVFLHGRCTPGFASFKIPVAKTLHPLQHQEQPSTVSDGAPGRAVLAGLWRTGTAVIPAGMPPGAVGIAEPTGTSRMCAGGRAEQQELIALTSGTGAGGGAGSRVSLSPLHTRGQETLETPAPCSGRSHHTLPPAPPHSTALPCSSLQDTGLRLLVQLLPLPPSSCPRGPRRAAPSAPACCQPRASPPRAPPMWPPMHAGALGRLHILRGCDHPNDTRAHPRGMQGVPARRSTLPLGHPLQCHPLSVQLWPWVTPA